ncbi:MAG: hypothetical protein ACLFOY_14360 [Desulfatibacillaceae bacterium]
MKISILRNRFTRRAAFAAATLLICAAALAGCGGGEQARGRLGAPGMKTLLVMPFQDMSARYGPGESVRSPISGQMFITGLVAEDSTDYLYRQVVDHLKANTSYRVIEYDAAEGVRSQVLEREGRSVGEREFVTEIGRIMEVDGVVAGYVYRFRQREGTAFAVDYPASVAFDLNLVRTADGRALWSEAFDQTQEPLSENLLKVGEFVQGGAKWLKAEDLAARGVDKVMAEFPRRRPDLEDGGAR